MKSFDIWSALLILFVTLVSGFYPFLQHRRAQGEYRFPIAESFAAGIFLAAPLIHMLGDASAQFYAHAVHYPMAFLLAGMMFLFLVWLEHVGRELLSHSGDSAKAFTLLATFMLSIHAFSMGVALGLGHSFSLMMIIFIAIV